MVRIRYRPVNVHAVMTAVVIGLAVCIAVTAVLDYVVLSWVIGIGYQPNALYGECLTAEMIAFGGFGAVLLKLSIPGREGNTLALAVFVTCLFFVFGNLEDWLYFIVGTAFFHGPFPSINLQWAWMPEATGVFGLPSVSSLVGFHGSWTTLNQAVWSILWLFVALPVALVAIFKVLKK
jgi:hypothetical protein